MITLGTWSDDVFRGAPADPAENLSFLERISRDAQLAGAAHNDEWQGPMRPGLSALFDAAERQTRLVDSSSARRAAMEDAYDRMIQEVRRVTGEDLPNPLIRNTTELAGRIGRGEFTGWQDPRLDELIAGRQDAFLARVQELKAKLGDRLNIDPFTPIGQQARQNAATAEADFKREWARTDLPLLGQVAALFGGAMIGSREDPLFWLSLPFGGPSKNAVTPLGRIATSALSNAAANAVFSAVAQPEVQGWRKDIGVEHGFGEAAQNVGMAFAIGGLAGGGLTGAAELMRGLRGAGSANRAIKAIEDAGGFVDDDTRAALRAAEMAGEADDATFRVPDGVNAAEGAQGLVDAARLAVEVDAPLPMGSRPVRPGVTDALARDILDNEADPTAALGRLRDNPDAIESAIASELADVRAAGYAATLGDAAFTRVLSGEADPVAASVVARMTSSEPHQAALLGRVIEAGARGEEAAREVVSDAIRALSAREAAAAQMGVAPEHLLTPAEMKARRTEVERAFGADLLDRVGALDGRIDAARRVLDDLLSARAAVPDTASGVAATRIAELRAELAGITGKRRTSPHAKELAATIARLEAAQALTGDNLAARLDSDILGQRQRIADLTMERAGLGPEMNALRARVDAEMTPFAARDLPFVFGDPDWVNSPAWRSADAVMKRDGLRSRDVALERAVLEESLTDPDVKRIVDDVAGGELRPDGQTAPADRSAAAAPAGARSGEGRAAGAEPRARGGDDDGAGRIIQRVPVQRSDGAIAFVTPDEAVAVSGLRERFLSDLASLCKV